MTYIECPECGQKALSVATRCPRCGHNYPQRPIWKQASSPKLDRLRPLLPIVAVLVLGVVLVVVIVASLRRGWYRVLADGHTLGYVHRSNLDAVPPPTQP